MRRDCRDPIPVAVEPNSMLSAARHGGEISAGRVGNSIKSNGVPVISYVALSGFPYLLDIAPNLSGSRVINLSAAADKSATTCIMTSYDATTPFEQNPGTLETIVQTRVRSHALLVQFGAGNVRHSYEIDVSQGSTANVPGSHAEVSLLDYSFVRASDNATLLAALSGGNFLSPESAGALVSHANVAAGAHPFQARLTTKVFIPFQVDVDLANPPAFGDFLDLLVNAIAQRTIVTVVP